MNKLVLIILFLNHIIPVQALFFGSTPGCASQPVCSTTCPVCSPCPSYSYPAEGRTSYSGNYGEIAPYSPQYVQPSHVVSRPVSSGYVRGPFVAPAASVLPPLIQPLDYPNEHQVSLQQPDYANEHQVSLQQPDYQQETSSYSEQPSTQTTTTSSGYNEPTTNFEDQLAPQQVTPSLEYLDVDVHPVTDVHHPVSASTFSPTSNGYEEYSSTQVNSVTPSTTAQSPPYERDEGLDYLQPTGLDDTEHQNNEQRRQKIRGVKTHSSRCNSEELKQIMEENIADSPSISKKRIQGAASELFNGFFDVICSRNNFSYVVSTQLFCELSVEDIICFAFLHKFD